MPKRTLSVTYASTYTSAYKRRNTVNEWIQTKILKSNDLRVRMWNSLHMIKAKKTQSIGKHISHDVFESMRTTFKLASLEARLRLRSLQHRIIQHLWRPNGRLASQDGRLASQETKCIYHDLNGCMQVTPSTTTS